MTSEEASPARRLRAGVLGVVATVTGNLFLVFGGLLFGALAGLAALVPPRGRYSFPFARAWARGLLASSFVRLRVRGSPEASRGQRVVYMANHQSLYDIPVLLATVPGRVCFLAKRSLFRIPVFGWAMRAVGFVPIDRSDRSRAREAFQMAMTSLASGVPIVIYPEETRSEDGRVLPFKSGGFLMALRGRVPIVPVGIRGTLAARPKGALLLSPGVVEVEYGDAIDVSKFGIRKKEALMEATEAEIARLARASRTSDVG
ncbi:MAG: lysophospholipid acyltransferase family protein [Acidobacteriota bacterium]|nr:lysophospholipid acyltransferase family protein [Acidobacteriota bacterium]